MTRILDELAAIRADLHRRAIESAEILAARQQVDELAAQNAALQRQVDELSRRRWWRRP